MAALRGLLRCALVLVLAGAASSCGSSGSPAHAAGTVSLSGQLSGRAFPAPGTKPIRLRTDQRTILDVQIANRGTQEVQVDTIVLRGRVMGLTFFSVETSVAISVPSGGTVNRQFSLNLTSLKAQALGLFRSNAVLLDPAQHTLASEPIAVDVRGSWRSVYALFGYALVMATVTSFVLAVVDLSRHRLSRNRWYRGVRFLVPGLGLGLTLIFALSALRIFLPGPLTWIPVVFISSTCGFVLGYLTPHPDEPPPSTEVPFASPKLPSPAEFDELSEQMP